MTPLYSSYIKWSKIEKGIGEGVDRDALNIAGKLQILFFSDFLSELRYVLYCCFVSKSLVITDSSYSVITVKSLFFYSIK